MEDEWKIMDGCGRFCTMSRWAPEITRGGSAEMEVPVKHKSRGRDELLGGVMYHV